MTSNQYLSASQIVLDAAIRRNRPGTPRNLRGVIAIALRAAAMYTNEDTQILLSIAQELDKSPAHK